MSVTLPLSGSDEVIILNPAKIIAIGLNYRAHIAESSSVKVQGMDGEEPSEPVLFNKTPNVLIAPGEPIPLPLAVKDYNWSEGPRTDYEGELVVIIGRTGKHIAESEAFDYILGYTCGIDVSQRNIQNGDRSGWFRGKSFDGFGPIGPVVQPSGSDFNPTELKIETRLNGKTVQDSNTSMMIFPIPRLIAYISRQMTLEKGDLIFTGTPSGVGPLKHGDTVEVEIEGIGTLVSPVCNEQDRS